MPKTILHIDMDSYFATCEQQANPHLRGKPIVVSGPPSGRTIVAAASREAKKYGIKSAMPVYQAQKLCPHLYFVIGDAEKYLDLTKRIINIFLAYTEMVEVFSIDEVFMDITDIEKRYGSSQKIAQAIKKRLKKEIGEWMTCSIGIAPNKLIAKLASGLKKPDGLVEVKEKEISSLLKTIELEDLCGIGSRLKHHLAFLGIKTMEDLQKYPLFSLIKIFGINGYKLHQMSLGKDDSKVLPYHLSEQEKSMGHQYTLPQNTLDKNLLRQVLLKLAEKVGVRLRKANLAGRVITVGIRYADFNTITKQQAVGFFTDDGYKIYQVVKKILDRFSFKKPVRLVGVSVSQLTHFSQRALPFTQIKKQRALLKAMDEINNCYGDFTLQRASLIPTKKMRKDIASYGLLRKF